MHYVHQFSSVYLYAPHMSQSHIYTYITHAYAYAVHSGCSQLLVTAENAVTRSFVSIRFLSVQQNHLRIDEKCTLICHHSDIISTALYLPSLTVCCITSPRDNIQQFIHQFPLQVFSVAYEFFLRNPICSVACVRQDAHLQLSAFAFTYSLLSSGIPFFLR